MKIHITGRELRLPEGPVKQAIRETGFPSRDVKEGRTKDMGERWVVSELQADGHSFITDSGFYADLDAQGREIARRPANRIRRREHLTLDDAITDYLAVLRGGNLPQIDHAPDGRSGSSGYGKLTPLEIAKLVVKAGG